MAMRKDIEGKTRSNDADDDMFPHHAQLLGYERESKDGPGLHRSGVQAQAGNKVEVMQMNLGSAVESCQE